MADEDSELHKLRREVLKLRQENALLSGRTQVLKEGLLLRFREQVLSLNWKQRFFDLRVEGDGAVLRCFEVRGGRKEAVHGEPRMTVRLSEEVEILRESRADSPGRRTRHGEPEHCFQIKLPQGAGPTKILRLGATSEDEALAWVEAISTACEGTAKDPKDGPKLRRVNSRDVPSGPPKLSKANDTSALRPVHTRIQDSVLTSEDGGIPECNVVGIVNLSVTVMVLIHFRLIYENVNKHGLVLDTFRVVGSSVLRPGNIQCSLCFLSLPLIALSSLGVELLASKGYSSDAVSTSFQILMCTLCLAVPVAVIRDTRASPPVGGTLLFAATVLFLKLVSFAHVNWALRKQFRQRGRAKKDDDADATGGEIQAVPDSKYPANLGLKDLVMFIAYPTLVYQTDYPRTDVIRKRWLAKRFGELLVCVALISIIAEQFVVPTLKRSAMPVMSLDIVGITVAILKLAVPNVYLWLFMFYALFHLWLNILAELTYFGDRLFYKEWWNATKLEDYWRFWNLPVHNWLVKHIFLPVLNSGFGKQTAVFMTFLVSAIFHELLVSVPCHTLRLWAFLGMMAQLPLVGLTAAIDKKLKGSQLGNVVFWISFCIVGQPLCVLLYFAEV